MPLSRDDIAKRIALEIEGGFTVNLGIGIPTLVANYIPKNLSIMLQSENGLLGIGPFPKDSEVDADLINAGKQTVTAVKGASFFSSAESFAMIRGSHIDLTVLGAMEVDEQGNIANWMIPNKMIKGMGGAMDLVAGAKKVIVAMNHTDRKQNPKLLKKCKLPLTGLNCVNKVVSDYGVFDISKGKFILKEIASDLSVEDVMKATEGRLDIDENLKQIPVTS